MRSIEMIEMTPKLTILWVLRFHRVTMAAAVLQGARFTSKTLNFLRKWIKLFLDNRTLFESQPNAIRTLLVRLPNWLSYSAENLSEFELFPKSPLYCWSSALLFCAGFECLSDICMLDALDPSPLERSPAALSTAFTVFHLQFWYIVCIEYTVFQSIEASLQKANTLPSSK